MKQIYSLFILLLCYMPYLSMAQQLKISPGGEIPQCPGNIVNYNTYMSGGPAPNYTGCSFKWSITRGKFFLTGNSNDYTTTDNSVAVIWDDVTQKGTLTVVLTKCSTTSLNDVPVTTGGVIIKSINGVNPSQVKVNGTAYTSYNLNWCSTSPITLSIDRLKIPNTPSASDPVYNTQLYTDWYEWTLPAGWRTNDNQTGTFTTQSYSITVIPEAGPGGR